jgi:arginyl-tRNA synthetase
MQLHVHARIKETLRSTIRTLWNIEPPDIVLNQTPKSEMGELASPVCFELAKRLKKSPKAVAEELKAASGVIPGIRQIQIAGAGYINFFLDRAATLRESFEEMTGGNEARAAAEKVIVEHTNINPNKAAHIGHLRNSTLGDTFVRILKASGHNVEVQNYIDNTGVQVADVIVGFQYLEKKSVADVRQLIGDPAVRFDYYCWDLYAKVSAFYESEDPKHALRGQTLKEIEESGNATSEMAELVAMRIVRCHLATMARIGVHYDLLPRESDILHLKFWDRAFEQMKLRNAIFLETEGKNNGCWVMRIDTEGYDDDKVIVRSNGTVTYVGKDIAYQLWKLGLLDQDFRYCRLEDLGHNGGTEVWISTSEAGAAKHPDFGHGHRVYNVIDVRQSYLQNVVRQGLLGLGYEEQVRNSVHFHYEVVALSPACADELGIEISPEDRKRPHIEVSGRKGQGVKADDLLDRLAADALLEVRQRNAELTDVEAQTIAHQIAVGALRYFLLKFTRTAIIAFDFKEALSFDGETGPYLQYAAVRANNIIRKAAEAGNEVTTDKLLHWLGKPGLELQLADANEIWDVLYSASRLDEMMAQVLATLEPASLAKYTFTLAQQFNLFYHRYRILSESDPERRMFYLSIVELVRRVLAKALDMMGIQVPQRM